MSNPDQPPARSVSEEEAMRLPRWVPLTIGIVLVSIALLAVYTGLTYRSHGLGRALSRIPGVNRIQDRGGAPGEPEPGASRIIHGEAGDAIPLPYSDPSFETRVAISGGKEGVVPSIRLSARRGIIVKVDPSDAIVYVNDKPMGTAAQFSTPDQAFEFAEEGTFTIRLVAPGFKEYEYVVTTDAEAQTEVAVLEVKLARE